MTDRHQELMDQAYARWQKTPSMTKEAFWDSLSPAERFAVFTGNLVSQVQNGGFLQWSLVGNAYGTEEVVHDLQTYLRQMGTPAALVIRDLVTEVWEITKYGADDLDYSDFGDHLDDTFYEWDDVFLTECEAYIQANFK